MDERLEPNKKAIRRLTESFNSRDRAAFDSCYANEIVVHASDGNDRRMDHEAHWEEVQGIFRAFPDLGAVSDVMLAEGDRVFVGWTYSGTHTGKTQGSRIEPTGKRAAWKLWCVYRLEDEKVVEAWNIADVAHLYWQLGLTELPQRK